MAPLVLGGEVDFAFSGGTHAQYTDTGEMRVLAFLTRERSPFYPDVPTLVELGYDYAMEDFRSFILPADASDDVVAAFEAVARHAVEHPDFDSITVDNTLHPVVFMDHAETEERIRAIRAANEALMAN
jgi:tripartite-type tricarboxylate transporter receptor subunit TctC